MFKHITYTKSTIKEKVEKIKEMDVIKIKNFCSSKDTTKRVKRLSTDREKILAIHIFNKRLTLRMFKELLYIKKTKPDNPFKKKNRQDT